MPKGWHVKTLSRFQSFNSGNCTARYQYQNCVYEAYETFRIVPHHWLKQIISLITLLNMKLILYQTLTSDVVGDGGQFAFGRFIGLI